MKQGVVWGSLLILLGVLSLVDQFVELGPWPWVGMFAVIGVLAFVLYLVDRSDWSMLLGAYIVWAIGLLIALVSLDVLRDEAVAFFVLGAIALPFLFVFLRDRAQWWALIPAYVMLAVGLMVYLIGLGILGDLTIPAYVLLAIALPFLVTFLRDRSQWWALIPGGITAFIGLSFLIAQVAVEYIGAVVLILIGVGMLVRVFTRRAPPQEPEELEPEVPETPLPVVPEAIEPADPSGTEAPLDEPPTD
jgi:hypothetical protein